MQGTNMNYIYTCLLALFLCACALSPQVVVINPDIKVETGATVAKPTVISVEAVDVRTSPVIGQRGGVYAETSNISTDNNMTATLEKNMGRAFSELGYKVARKGEPADAALTLKVTAVSYATQTEKKVLKSVETRVEVQAVCSKQGREFTGSYNATRTKNLIKVPSEQENEQLVNEVFTVVLNTMIKDQDLIAFIDK